MEELEVTCIVLSSMPFKEKDRLISVFTVELGVVTCIAKGVSAQSAKLKPIAQPFCFAKIELTKSNEFYVIKGISVIDSFFDITNNYDNFVISSSLLEICKIILKPNIIAENLFIMLVKTLQNIVYNDIDCKLSATKFMLTTLKIIGYDIGFEYCDNCNMKFMGDIKFNIETGTFRCVNCSGGVVVSKTVFMNLKIISATPIDRLSTLKVKSDILDSCLNLLYKNLERRLNCTIKSLKNY